jgi:sporulation protein YlmC with PRC-barrel domain
MIRKLLATTAISLIATTGAWAAQNETQAMAPEMTQEGYVQNIGQAELASSLIGKRVYTSDAPDAESIGDINDLVIGEDGSVQAVVIGVGGFLGIGEKNVAVGFDKIRWTQDENGNEVVVFEASKESLQSAPEFVPPEHDTAMAPSGDMMSTGETSAENMPSEKADAAKPNELVSDEMIEENSGQRTETAMTSTEEPDTSMAPAGDAVEETAVGTDMGQSPKDNLMAVDTGSVSAEQLLGATVYSSDDQDIGEVGDVRLAPDGGKVDAMIVDIGGFLGLGEKPVAIGFDNLKIRKDEAGDYYVYTDFTREELESAPNYDEATYDDQRDTMRLTMNADQ